VLQLLWLCAEHQSHPSVMLTQETCDIMHQLL